MTLETRICKLFLFTLPLLGVQALEDTFLWQQSIHSQPELTPGIIRFVRLCLSACFFVLVIGFEPLKRCAFGSESLLQHIKMKFNALKNGQSDVYSGPVSRPLLWLTGFNLLMLTVFLAVGHLMFYFLPFSIYQFVFLQTMTAYGMVVLGFKFIVTARSLATPGG